MDAAGQFVAIDVETANADLASICQVGIVVFRNGAVVDSWSSLINPQDYFDGINTSIHGIDEEAVKGAPTWPQLAETLRNRLASAVAACHTPFDRAATVLACKKYRVSNFDCRWLDTARVVRRTWPEEFAAAGYGLANVADFLGIKFKHHDALEDARAAGQGAEQHQRLDARRHDAIERLGDGGLVGRAGGSDAGHATDYVVASCATLHKL